MSKLNNTYIKNIKPQDKPVRHTDGKGLYLYVLPSGGKSWRIDYAHEKKRDTLVLGLYPAVTLVDARQALADLKLKLNHGIDPKAEKKEAVQAIQAEINNAFENIACKWIDITKSEMTIKHKQDIVSKLERFIYPTFKGRDINSISSKDMLEVIRKVEAKGLYETTKKTLGICSQIFSFAVGEGQAKINICSGLSRQLKTVKSKNHANITDRKELGILLAAIDTYSHNVLIKIGLQIAPLVFVRPSELAQAKWEEIDFKERLWTIPSERMKRRKKHLVPLSKQVISLLQALHEITGDTEYLFYNWNTNKPITIEGLRKGLIILGYKDKQSTHGFRHTASTVLNERGYNSDWIETQLAHREENTVRAVYNHAEYLPERRIMMQEWADYLVGLK